MRRRTLPPVREEGTKKPWRKLCDSDFFTYTLVASVGALVYVNSLSGDFVHDDIPAIVANGDVNGGNPALTVWKNDFWGTPMSDPRSHKSYRPLTTLTFRINYLICGLSPRWWHVCNLALHAACCALVVRTAAVVARLNRPFAALAGLLFAVHPIHTEAVAGVVGRADILACMFFLCSILVYHGNGERHHLWRSILLATAATLAKETGLTALLFNLIFDLYQNRNQTVRWVSKGGCQVDRCFGRCMVTVCALASLGGARLLLLQGGLPEFSQQDNPPAAHPDITVRTLTYCYLAAFNWWMLLCPSFLSHDWQMGSIPLVTSLWDLRNLVTSMAVVTLLALVYRCLTDLELQRDNPVVAGALLLVLPYLPASNLLVTVGFVVAERVLYIPSVGSALLTAYGIQLIWRWKFSSRATRRLLLAAITVLVAAGVARTYVRNKDWRNRESLLRADLATLPHNAKLHYNFGNFLKDIEKKEDAISHYKEALRLWPSYASAHNNLGTLVVRSGGAEGHFLQALSYNPHHLNARYNLAKLYRKKNIIPEAIRLLECCIKLEPRFVRAYIELALLRPKEERRPALDKLLELEPNNWEHYIMYGNWFKEKGLIPLALQYYTRALSISWSQRTDAASALRAACLILRHKGQRDRILQLLTRWYSMRDGDRSRSIVRARAARAWRMRGDIEHRARLYSRGETATQTSVASTCLHHSHLEIKAAPKISSLLTINKNRHENTPNKTVMQLGGTNFEICNKNVLITAQYKTTYDKSLE